jgi:DNA-binding NarL/FixJ family response regulator
LGRHKGAEDNPRNRMIIDLHKKGKSYNQIAKEIERSGFSITVQRVGQIINQGILQKIN